MYLAKNILYLRKLHNMTQTDLSEKFGYDNYTTVHKWETGKADPPVKIVKALADLFNVDIDELVRVDLERASVSPAPSTTQDALSEDEMILVRGYRVASPDRREDMLDLARKALKNKEGVNSSSSQGVGEEAV